MVASNLNRIADVLVRRRAVAGTCATCHGSVFGDERHVRLHGVLVHRRCVAYRRRG